MKASLRPCLLLAATLMVAIPGFAQTPAVTSNLTAQRVVMTSGKAVLSPAEAAKPGDMVEYSGTYHNAGTGSVDKLVATIPVPAGTTFVSGSADPAKAQASTDGVRFAPMPLMRTVRLPDGTSRQEQVPLAEYRFLRWEVGTLAPRADAVVKLRVQIDAAGAVAATKP